jgi:uncharacterized damage-inducible protein DinB
MHPSVTPLAALFRLNTELLLNCVARVDDASAARRVTPSTNSIAFLVAHLTDTRHYLAGLLGAPLDNPLTRYLAKARSLDEVSELPSLGHLLAEWERIAAHLAVEVERLDTPALARPLRGRFPGGDGTLLGAMAFLAQHESYHVGQLALLRRQLGFPAMSYAFQPREAGRAGA